MTRPEQARAMAAADPALTNADIARRLGVARGTVWKWLNPERSRELNAESRNRTRERRRASDRARSRRRRATCEQCGRPCGIGTEGKARRCAACFHAAHEARIALVARMYNTGRSTREIAAAIGYGPTSKPSVLIRECRDRGLIGYRRGPYATRAAT